MEQLCSVPQGIDPKLSWGCGFPLGDTVLLSCSGVVRVDISLQDVDIDQCSSDGWFGGTHRCNTTTMEVSSNT